MTLDCELSYQTLSLPLIWRSGRPIRERHGSSSANHRRDHVVEALMFLRRIVQRELRPEPQVVVVDRFDAADQPFARKVLPGSFDPLDHHHGVHESFKADEIGLLGGEILPERAPIESDGLLLRQIIRRHNLGYDHALASAPASE